MERVIEELPDDTYPVEMELFVNDEFADDNKRNFIEENETKLNGEDEDSTEVEEKEENVPTDSEISTIAKIDDNIDEICEGR